MANVTRKAWLFFLSLLKGAGGVPLSSPLVDAVTVIVCLLWLTDACAGCNIGMYSRVLEPEMATVMGAVVDGEVLKEMQSPASTAASIWGRIGSCSWNNCGPWSVVMWWSPPKITSSRGLVYSSSSTGESAGATYCRCWGSLILHQLVMVLSLLRRASAAVYQWLLVPLQWRVVQ